MRKEITHNGITYVSDLITIKTRDGDAQVQAILVNPLFAIHLAHQNNDLVAMGEIDPDLNYTLTHTPSGYSMLTGLLDLNGAYSIAHRLYVTLSDDQKALWNNPNLSPDMKALPKAHMKAVQKYLLQAKKVENNAQLERMVGVFYKDRELAERLRIKINPSQNTLMDEKAIGSEKLTASLIMGEFKLS